MSYCVPRYPSGFIRNNARIELPDYGDLALIETDTTKLYDMKLVRVAALLFNKYIDYIDLDQYPNLKDRLINGSYMSEGEMADVIYEIGYDPEVVIDILLNDIPTEIAIEDITDALDEYDQIISDAVRGDSGIPAEDIIFDIVDKVIGTGGGSNNNNNNNPDTSVNTSNSPIIDGPNIVTDINPVTRNYPGSGIVNIDDDWSPSEKVRTILDKVNSVYTSYDIELDSNSCSGGARNPLPNLFDNGLLSKFVDASIILGDLAGLGKNVSISGLVHSYIIPGIEGALSKIVNKAEQMMNTAMRQIDGIFDSVQSLIKGNFGANSGRRVFEMMYRKFSKLRLFFSPANGEMIKKKLREFAKIQEMQFEELSLPLVVSILLYRSCKFSSLLNSLFDGIVDEFKNLANRVRTEFTKLTNLSGYMTNSAVDLGAIRVPSKYRFDMSNKYADKVNNQSNRGLRKPGGGGSGYVPSSRTYIRKDLTPQETSWVKTLTKDGDPRGRFDFAASVQGMGTKATKLANGNPRKYPEFDPNRNYQDAGWDMVAKNHPAAFILLARVIEKMWKAGHRTGQSFVINSAYRSPTYNKSVGGASRSLHMSGMALDVSMAGCNKDGIKDFIKFASEEGFGGISYYDGMNFTHVDLGGVRTWIKTGDRSIISTLNKHTSGDYRNGTNNIRVPDVETAPTAMGDAGVDTPATSKPKATPNPGGILT